MINKRDFVTGAVGAALTAAVAQAQTARPANGLNPARQIPHGMMKTTAVPLPYSHGGR